MLVQREREGAEEEKQKASSINWLLKGTSGNIQMGV